MTGSVSAGVAVGLDACEESATLAGVLCLAAGSGASRAAACQQGQRRHKCGGGRAGRIGCAQPSSAVFSSAQSALPQWHEGVRSLSSVAALAAGSRRAKVQAGTAADAPEAMCHRRLNSTSSGMVLCCYTRAPVSKAQVPTGSGKHNQWAGERGAGVWGWAAAAAPGCGNNQPLARSPSGQLVRTLDPPELSHRHSAQARGARKPSRRRWSLRRPAVR